MKNDTVKYLLTLSLFLLAAITIACSGKTGKVSVSSAEIKSNLPESVQLRILKMVSPSENAEFRLGDAVKVVLEPEERSLQPDSVIIAFDGKHASSLRNSPWEFIIPSSYTASTGRKSVKATVFSQGKAVNVETRFVIVYSDTPPRRFGYTVIHTYPHDREAFTQGLFFSNGVIYEGTGQQSGSTLREVELTTGKVLRILNLSSDLFGEGITLYNGKIYQVTWQSKVGFVYEKETFRQLNKIYYQSEGWGLATIGNRIIMSDGSNVLYFYEPESFTVVSRIEVYDNEKKVSNLNELENVNGEIWANIWMTDLIARIDPSSGKVIGYIDLKGILKDPSTDTSVNVLNGIAYDSLTGRIFITGKNWPKLFEIKVTE